MSELLDADGFIICNDRHDKISLGKTSGFKNLALKPYTFLSILCHEPLFLVHIFYKQKHEQFHVPM